MRVLVIEDNLETRELVARALARDGQEVTGAADADEALAVIDQVDPEVIVLDLGLPGTSGLALCEALRRRGHETPLLVLTAQGAVSCRVACLDAGADDFLAKPFAIAELRARVRALGRRRALPKVTVYKTAELVVDVTARRATRHDSVVPLTAREWSVIERFVAARGRVVTRGEILEAVWGDDSEAASASLDVIIARIRRKLGEGFVRTARGAGYIVGDG
ncbi:MAG: response regulator transcription factor [Myxococcales bacterium]|nr:response regulator transcription factor [Myxococcales bacterium]